METDQTPPESFASGKKELEQIKNRLESDQINIDDLESIIDRGKFLIDYLTTKLKNIEEMTREKFKN